MSILPGTADTKAQKLVWNSNHDKGLIECVLQLKDLLRDPLRSYPRTKFWNAVSGKLRRKHGLNCNSRQSRDRFNLLFSKALVHKIDQPFSHREPTDYALDALLKTCTETFYFSNGKSLELVRRDPPRTFEGSPPSITCYDAQQLYAELQKVRESLNDLSRQVATIKGQVEHLQDIQDLQELEDLESTRN